MPSPSSDTPTATLGNDSDAEEPEEDPWDTDGAGGGGWDEPNREIDQAIEEIAKRIHMSHLDWDYDMQWGQICKLNPQIWKDHQRGFESSPPNAAVQVMVKACHSSQVVNSVCVGSCGYDAGCITLVPFVVCF